MSYTIAKGPSDSDYIITFADGRVLVVNALDFRALDSRDGVTDSVIDVDNLIANSDPNGTLLANFLCFAQGTWVTPQVGRFRSRSSPPVTWLSRWTTARNPSAGLGRASAPRPATWPQS